MKLYAVIKTAGREYEVSPGKSVKVDRLESNPGDVIEFSEISQLVRGDRVAEGAPWVEGAKVRARVKKHGVDNGVIVFKMGRRQLYRKKQDRQWPYTVLTIDEIVFEDDAFRKRDLDPRKIRKAQAAAGIKKPRKPRKADTSPTQPVPTPAPSVSPPPIPVELKTPSAPTPTSKASSSSKRGVMALVLLFLAMLGLLAWQQWMPPAAPVAETATPVPVMPTPEEVRLLHTRKLDRPANPAQPPD